MNNQSHRPDVSVVMPFYNASRWIGVAVQSLNDTTGLRIELIAVDDASTDESAAIVRATNAFPVELVQNHTRSGTTMSLNRGLTLARGRFIARMDADDAALPGRLAQQISYLQATGCDVCGTWVREVGRGIPRRLKYPVGSDAVHATLLFQTPICHPTLLARREVFEEFQYDARYMVAQDYDLLSRVSTKFRITNVPVVKLRYRRHSAQTTLAKRELVAAAASQIRQQTLSRRGLDATADEIRLHDLIRGPRAIHSAADLHGIETWLTNLCNANPSPAAKRVIAMQWIRACVRAGSLGKRMWQAYITSELHSTAKTSRTTDLNVRLLSKLSIDYESPLFALFSRFRIRS